MNPAKADVKTAGATKLWLAPSGLGADRRLQARALAATTQRSARVILRIQHDWPWAHQLLTAFARLRRLAAARTLTYRSPARPPLLHNPDALTTAAPPSI